MAKKNKKQKKQQPHIEERHVHHSTIAATWAVTLNYGRVFISYALLAFVAVVIMLAIDRQIYGGHIAATLSCWLGKGCQTVTAESTFVPAPPPTPAVNNTTRSSVAPSAPSAPPAGNTSPPAVQQPSTSGRTFTQNGIRYTITDPDPAAVTVPETPAVASGGSSGAAALPGIEWGWQPPEAPTPVPTVPAWLRAIQPNIPAIQPTVCHPPMTCAAGGD